MATILIVDDDEAIRGVLRAVVRREGHTVEEAADGVEALAKLQQQDFAAVLLDLMMPRMNGWEVLDELAREDSSRLGCVIVLSAAVPKKGLSSAHEALVHAVLTKPFDLEQLMVCVRSCVGTSGEVSSST